MENQIEQQPKYTSEYFRNQRRKAKIREKDILKNKKARLNNLKIKSYALIFCLAIGMILSKKNEHITNFERLQITLLDKLDDWEKIQKMEELITEAIDENITSSYTKEDLKHFYNEIMIWKNQKNITADDIDKIIGVLKNYSKYPILEELVDGYDKESIYGNEQYAILEDISNQDNMEWEVALGNEQEIIDEVVEIINKKNKDYQINTDYLKTLLEKIDEHHVFDGDDILSSVYPLDKNIQAEVLERVPNQYYSSLKIYPNWSQNANDITGYPVIINNQYLKNYSYVLPQIETRNDFNLEDYVNELLDKEGKKVIYNLIMREIPEDITYLSILDPKNETMLLLAMLNPEITLIQNHETVAEYLERIENYYQGRLNIYQFALAIETKNLSVMDDYFKIYLEELSKREIGVEDIYNYNLIEDYLYSMRVMTMDGLETYHSIDVVRELKNLLQAQNKEIYASLLQMFNVRYNYYNYQTGEKKLSTTLRFLEKQKFENYAYLDIPKGITGLDFYFSRYENGVSEREDISQDKIKVLDFNEEINRYFVEIQSDEDYFDLNVEVSLKNFLNCEENQVLSRKKQ